MYAWGGGGGSNSVKTVFVSLLKKGLLYKEIICSTLGANPFLLD